MKNWMILFGGLLMTTQVLAGMVVTSDGIKNGVIEDKYGKRGEAFIEGMPSYSLPVRIQKAPEGTKSYALVLTDPDSIPVAGFAWIHWSVANLTKTELKENEALLNKSLVQGTNSWSSALLPKTLNRMTAATYGGMAPPNALHTYELTVYALDSELPVQKGFYLNELYQAMDGHILDQYTLKGIYSN